MVFRLYNSGVAVEEDSIFEQQNQPATTEATKGATDDESATTSTASTTTTATAWTITLLILLLGCAASAAFLSIGILSAMGDSQKAFENDVDQVAGRGHSAFREYETAGRWVHQFSMSHKLTTTMVDNMNATESQQLQQEQQPQERFFAANFRLLFRELYESIVAQGLPLHAIQYVPNVTRHQRAAYEAEARNFYQTHYPQIAEHNYTGFSGLVPDAASPNGVSLSAQPPTNFYFPVHFVEPVIDNIHVIDFDIYSEDYPRWAVDTALGTMEPVITGRLRLLQEYDPNPDVYSVLLMHPGMKYSHPSADNDMDQDNDNRSGDVSLIAIRIPSLLEYIARQEHLNDDINDHMPDMKIYVYDSTPDDPTLDEPLFLGGASIVHQGGIALGYLPHAEFSDLLSRDKAHRRGYQTTLTIGRRQWTMVAIAGDGTYPPSITFAMIGGIMIFVAFLCLICPVSNRFL